MCPFCLIFLPLLIIQTRLPDKLEIGSFTAIKLVLVAFSLLVLFDGLDSGFVQIHGSRFCPDTWVAYTCLQKCHNSLLVKMLNVKDMQFTEISDIVRP